ncbi:hypothetical protein H4Q26_002858 [Puccinia striiformis f. sp. tritici PST-130]|nr:hypothetical protein H4Q26_002858 [Puccinia striiformis f. sp. tritici PST-130]
MHLTQSAIISLLVAISSLAVVVAGSTRCYFDGRPSSSATNGDIGAHFTGRAWSPQDSDMPTSEMSFNSSVLCLHHPILYFACDLETIHTEPSLIRLP